MRWRVTASETLDRLGQAGEPVYPELFKIPWINLTVSSYGAMLLVGFLTATWWMIRRAIRVKADPDIVLNLGFIVLICSMIGARAFYVVHFWDSQFAGQPGQMLNFRAGGFEFYGGFVGAFVPSVLYLWWKGLSVRLYADLIMPSILVGLGIGRIGCFLFGCCWGGICSPDLPWAVTFPYGSPAHQRQWKNRLVALPAELILIDPAGTAGPLPRPILKLTPEKMAELDTKRDDAATNLAEAKATGDAKKIARARTKWACLNLGVQTLLDHMDRFGATTVTLRQQAARPAFSSRPVHPAQIYASIGALLLAWLTNAYFYWRKRHGMVMVLGLMLYAVQRFIEEIVRVDNPHDTFGLTASQGISIAVFLIALASLLILRKLPLRSPSPARILPSEPEAQATG